VGAEAPAIAWESPSPAPGSVLAIEAGKKITFSVTAAAAAPSTQIKLKAGHLPQGATFRVKAGNPAKGTFSWRPSGPQIGDRTLTVAAQANGPVAVPATALPLTLHVVPGYTQLTTPTISASHWAFVDVPAAVRSAPSSHARPVGRIGRWTPENYPNLVTMLEQRVVKSGTWVHVRFPKLPNNTTGWVKRGALGRFHATNLHVVVNRSTTTLVLYRNGSPIFRTRVGVGQPRWPTPRGEHYITEKLTGFHDAAYGPIAFGTSARSAVLTDWPGGGFIGIHGTNAPGLIPGHISHGCIRVRNWAVIRLARLMHAGTPLTVL
jgi:lipoprotein-anchoring transpeptidase ErfK/SrfK